MTEITVSDPAALLKALGDPSIDAIAVDRRLSGLLTFGLRPGCRLFGRGEAAELVFADGSDGVRLTTDNRLASLAIRVSPERCAIYNDTTVASLGRLEIASVRTVGQVRITARDQVRGGHVDIDGLDIVEADVRERPDRPHGYGVHVVQGALTVWNMQADADVLVTARIVDVRVGRPGAPVHGGGVFVSGAGDTGGRLHASLLQTGPVHSHGGIEAGTPDLISGGVFVVHGAFVDAVRNVGPITTYGPNDMVLDNWGSVDRWTAEDKVTSFGPSGIGFVNFGVIDSLRVEAPIETFGQGARGFNVYTGTVRTADFDRVVTHADGAVGIQVSQPVGRIRVRRGIETHGGTGDSLVKGVVVELSAIPFSIKPGGSVRALVVAGGLIARSPGIDAMELHGGVESMTVRGGMSSGAGFQAL